MSIVYNPGNTGGSRTRLEVQPWTGMHEFLVDESPAAGCTTWVLRVRIEWDADAAAAGGPSPVQIRYKLEDYDCRDLVNRHVH